jgi:hypothetical protein
MGAGARARSFTGKKIGQPRCRGGFLRVNIPGPFNLVWLAAFLLFVAELYLVTSYEGEHGLRAIGLGASMYFTYCQAWLIVVFRALWHQYVLREGSRWDKTTRFGTSEEAKPKVPALPPRVETYA